MSEPTLRNYSWRMVAGALLFAALVGFGLKPFYVRFFVADRTSWGRLLEAFPDRRAPGYVELLRDAGDHIPLGARVAIVFPTLDWSRGYSYAYFRAQYLLAGRTVVPLSWIDGARPERIQEVEYVVAYQADAPSAGWTVLVRNQHGVVLRRGP